MIEVVVCETGVKRHAPELRVHLDARGMKMGTVECFDRCETCERHLIARINGATTRFPSGEALLEALAVLAEE